MGQFRARLAFLASAAVMLIAGTAQGSITRVSGPTNLFNESKVFVKFDAAFDSVNRVYLAVWGTQFAGPTNGLFLNEAGAPIGNIFAISDHSDGALQAGWARVVYSPQQGKFLVSYVKIFPSSVHAKAARFVAYSGGAPALSSEIRIATWAGHPGTESGIAYSAAAGKFLVSWWVYYGARPVSFITVINPAGAIESPAIPNLSGWGTPITNPNDGQSDPEIACDSATRHCLVIGWSWGTFYGGNSPPPAVWGRYIDDATGAPLGPDSFYLPTLGYIDSPTVSFGAGRFLVAYTGNGQVLGNVASGSGVDVTTFSSYFGLRVSSAATSALDGGGFRYPSLSFNSATNTTLLGVSGYMGYPVAQEIDATGNPIAGALDYIPDPGPNFDARTQYTIPVANSVSGGFLYLDNHYFVTMRVSRYSATAGPPPPPPPPSRSTLGDFDGDGRSEIGIWRPTTGEWWLRSSAGGFASYGPFGWGSGGDIPVAADYDGDRRTDFAVYRPSTGVWYILKSSTNFTAQAAYGWGGNADVPVPGDYDGDRKTDIAVYRPSNGAWYILNSSTNFTTYGAIGWGAGGDVPVPGDYDGDGKTDLAIYRPSVGAWYILTSSSNFTTFIGYTWGAGTDVPVTADYDGDGRTDIAVYRLSTGVWYILKSSTNFTGAVGYAWGVGSDVPTPADYDGDGKADIAIYRPGTGTWYILKSSTNFTTYDAYDWGTSGDVPILRRP
jgi:FG-GAP-like repeat